MPDGTRVRVTFKGEARPLAYAVVDRTRDGAPMLRTFQKKTPARAYAKKHKATLVAKQAGHAGFTVLEDFSGDK